MSKFRFDAFNIGLFQLHALLCSEHGASHFEQFFSVLIRYVVKKFTTYFILHFNNWLADFWAPLYFLRFSHPSRDSSLGGGGVGGNEGKREVLLQRESNSAFPFRKGYVLIHHTVVFLITDKLRLYYFVGLWG
jgi:hypothetical protein